MENRVLKLHIAKGPRQGDELEFKAGSRIRIGRVVRGNNVTIKDDGISSKHLSIESDPKSGAWILQDLGSSNGTFINGSSDVLTPNTPYIIKNGDCIKIGESTSIVVTLEDSCVVEEVSELPPLNPRRRGITAAAGKRRKLKEADKSVKADTGALKETTLELKNEAEKSVKAAAGVVLKETLGLKNKAEENVKASGGVLKETVGLKEAGDEIVKEDMVLKEAPRLSPRRTRSRMKKVVDEQIGNINCEDNKRNLGKRTRASSRRKQNDVEKELNPVVIAADNVNSEVSILEEEEEEEENGQPDEMCDEKEEDLGGREKGNESAANGSTTLDLTKLTVRELFAYLEENIPKQIIAETDKSLAAMREKVERIKDYVREQRKKNSGELSAP